MAKAIVTGKTIAPMKAPPRSPRPAPSTTANSGKGWCFITTSAIQRPASAPATAPAVAAGIVTSPSSTTGCQWRPD